MSRRASEFQYKAMSLAYRGKEIFKPLNTGWIDGRVACVREYAANVFFHRKGTTTIMIDAGYSYDRLEEKMGWLGIDAADVHDILITHQDTDHVGAVERDSAGLFSSATLYVGREEMRYLTGERRRRVYWGTYRLPQVHIDNRRKAVDDLQVFWIGDTKVEAILVPGHTFGHMVYLVDDEYLFTGDAIWLGPDGGKSFLDTLAEDNRLALRSLARLRRLISARGIRPKVITGHTGWTDDVDFAFAHTDEVCHALYRQTPHDPSAPFDAYREEDDTAESARAGLLGAVVPVVDSDGADGSSFWNGVAFAYDMATRGGDAGLAACADHIASYVGERDVVLDAACGTGAFATALAPHAGFVGACDIAPNMVRRAEAKARRLGLSNVAFGVADLCGLCFSDDTFDVAVAANVLHLLKDPHAALAELTRVVRPKGIVALPTYVSAPGGNERLMSLARALGFQVSHAWDEDGYLAFLERAGMRVIDGATYEGIRPLCLAICRMP